MIKAKSRVKLNMGVIKKLSTAAVTSLEQTADAVQSDLKQSQVMPFDKGTLPTHLGTTQMRTRMRK